MWCIDHVHLRTLPDGQKVYGLVVLDAWSRVLVSEEVCLTKGARDACLILIRAFARYGLPEEILSDNAKAFTSLLYRLLMGILRIRVRYTDPGCPWQNPFAESFIGVLRAYFYPHMQRQMSVTGVADEYATKADYYNHRVHWAFRKDAVKTPLGKLDDSRGRPLPENFSLSIVATGKRFGRTVDNQGRISWQRYRLFVHSDLKNEKVEIREFLDSLVVTYKSGTVVSYACSHERKERIQISNDAVFHDHPRIEMSGQLELFDLSVFPRRYVSERAPYRKRIRRDASQFWFALFSPQPE